MSVPVTWGSRSGFRLLPVVIRLYYYDISQNFLDKAMDRIGKLAKNYIEGGSLNDQSAEEALKRIRTTVDAEEAGKSADFVSESMPEDPDLKGRVFFSV